jgi:hypothetical protein
MSCTDSVIDEFLFLRGCCLRGGGDNTVIYVIAMRPKDRGMAQYGGTPGWLEESDLAGLILYVMDGPYRLSFPYHTSCPEELLMKFPAANIK